MSIVRFPRWSFPRSHPLDLSPVSFLPSVKVLSRVFRGKFVAAFRRAFRQKKLRFHGPIAALQAAETFASFPPHRFSARLGGLCQPAFGGPAQVLRYLGRYTHRVAISNHRLLAFDGEHVTFRWRDYAHGSKKRKMTLSGAEFLRRFVQHILPRGFVRIRQYGFLANRCRAASPDAWPPTARNDPAPQPSSPDGRCWPSQLELPTLRSGDAAWC